MCIFRSRPLFALLLSIHCMRVCHSSQTWRRWLQQIRTRRKTAGVKLPERFPPLFLRGGSSNEPSDIETLPASETLSQETSARTSFEVLQATPSPIKRLKSRHTYNLLLDLNERSRASESNGESFKLRELIMKRSKDYLADLREAVESNDSKLPHPKRLLHYLAQKVPAIKQSPELNLRIYSARSDIDSGVAACIIGALAHVSEIYDKEKRKRSETDDRARSVAPDLTTDRRFEQLIECVLGGVNVQKRKKQSLTRQLEKNSEEATDIEQVLDEEDAQLDEGLSIRDSCRAAWGIGVLGCSHLDTLADVKVLDLLLALSLRIRELLLARLQLLRQDDLFSDPSTAHLSTGVRLNEVAEELAEDAATAMWTFAGVKACTGMRSVPLFEACCSILCQDPIDMRSRAQAADYEQGVPIGTNDIIDRLAHSETVEKPVLEAGAREKELDEAVDVGKDALLDWLSPTEVNDVLWAIAVHGSNNTSASDEVTLSETASALKEIAFDRMVEWLEHDMKLFEHAESANESIVNDDSTVAIEVVDAAALLASQQKLPKVDELSGNTVPVEDVTVRVEEDIQEVEVVDAATLLASMDGQEIETEIIRAKPIMEASLPVNSEETNIHTARASEHEVAVELVSQHSQIFSPHDLASMAWSATELRDPLRVQIVGMVLARFEKLGAEGMTRLRGGDLANLAWGVSRYESTLLEKDPDRSGALSGSVLSWIAHKALYKSSKDASGKESPRRRDLLQFFQPPELGRLNWAVATTFSSYSEGSGELFVNSEIRELARISLEAAASNLELFAPEDLLRISWAFLEICRDSPSLINLPVADALGRILATVEQSLHRWERGAVPSSSNQASEASIFSSFFGKPRLNHQLLEHMLNDGEDEDDSPLGPLLQKSRKPLLRDLSVDPSTLCRAACAFQRLSKQYPYMKGGWTLTRVAIRLLSSKNARLMKECSIHDIVKLCEATVLCEADGQGRELITGLFARKVLQVLNESLDCEQKEETSTIDLSRASSSELCTLIWALGELGTKHHRSDESRHSAYKRMRLVAPTPLLSQEQVKKLECSSVVKLFRGVVLMNFLSSDKPFLLLVLEQIQEKAKNLKSGSQLCSLAESLGALKEGLKPGKTSDNSKTLRPETVENSNLDSETTDGTDSELTNPKKTSGGDSGLTMDECVIEKRLLDSCVCALEIVGKRARDTLGSLKADEIRRLLVVYSLLPCRNDELIDDIAEEVKKRQLHLQQSPKGSIETILSSAKSSALSVNTTVFGDANSESRFDSIKNGILAFFSTSEGDESPGETRDPDKLTEELTSSIQQSTATTSRAANSVKNLHVASGISMDSVFQNIQKGTAFELGRCVELIENYRRIEFSTGTLRSRYDKERRKEIAKRVLGRLLP